MAKIFISYSSQDKKIAIKIANDLTTFGHSVWYDEWQIKVGESIPTRISDGIDECEYLVLLLTQASVKSGWVENEWQSKYFEQIEKRTVMILPALLEECEIPRLLKPIKYADFRKSYGVGLVQLTSSIGPTIPSDQKVNIKENELDSQLSLLIEKVQSGNEPLSKYIAEALTLSRHHKLSQLEKFCKYELSGWGETNEKDMPDYRAHEVFLSPFGQVNLNYMAWAGNPSALFEYMRKEPEQFFPRKLIFPEPIFSVEEKAKKDLTTGVFTLSMPMKYFVKKTDKPDAPVQIYSSPDTYKNILQAIKTELTRLLLEKLPTIS